MIGGFNMHQVLGRCWNECLIMACIEPMMFVMYKCYMNSLPALCATGSSILSALSLEEAIPLIRRQEVLLELGLCTGELKLTSEIWDHPARVIDETLTWLCWRKVSPLHVGEYVGPILLEWHIL